MIKNSYQKAYLDLNFLALEDDVVSVEFQKHRNYIVVRNETLNLEILKKQIVKRSDFLVYLSLGLFT